MHETAEPRAGLAVPPERPEGPIPVQDLLCLALHRASRAMTAQYRPLLAPHGLTYPQYLVVALLHQDGPMTVGGVGQQLGLESSTLSPLLSRLADRALVERSRGTGDERRVQVALTPAGHDLGEQLAGIPDEVCAAAGLSREAARGVVGELMELVAAMEQQGRRVTHD